MMKNSVSLHYPSQTIAQITMQNREYQNTFTSEMMEGLISSFESLHSDTKVVILTGCDNYFCCGGTPEQLMRLAAGEFTFDQLNFYRILLDCEVPTISAMQGHALGGGFVFGCYADLLVMAEECLYSTNFMKFGFTPGMGGTYIVPKKLGEMLGQEMLFTANNYSGSLLKQRNAQVNIVKKIEVLNTALSLAKSLAEKPLISLKLLKENRNQKIRSDLPKVIEQELLMHEITLKLPSVKEKLVEIFAK